MFVYTWLNILLCELTSCICTRTLRSDQGSHTISDFSDYNLLIKLSYKLFLDKCVSENMISFVSRITAQGHLGTYWSKLLEGEFLTKLQDLKSFQYTAFHSGNKMLAVFPLVCVLTQGKIRKSKSTKIDTFDKYKTFECTYFLICNLIWTSKIDTMSERW